MHVLLLSNVSSFADARLAGGHCGFDIVCALGPAAAAGLAALFAHLSFAPAVRSHRFARPDHWRLVADLLFRAIVSPSNLVLETPMETGRLAKPNHFHRAISNLALGGDEERLFVCRGGQFSGR